MNYANKRERKGVRGGVRFFVLTVILCMVSLWQLSILRRELPSMIEWYSKDGYAYSDRQLQQLSESAQAGFYVQARQPVTEEICGNTQEMTVRWADQEYLQWSGIKLEAGRWPKGQQQSGGEAAAADAAGEAAAADAADEAAVSDAWAVEHYKYLDVTGRTVRVGDSWYRISGVYSAADSWRQQMAGDGADILYLCFQPEHLPEDYCMNYLYFAKNGADFQNSQSYLETMAASVTGMRAVPDICLDIESVRHVCMQNIVVCGILWLFFAAVFLGSAGRKMLGYLTLLVCAVCIVMHQWYIPMVYLPKENVFDFAGYVQRYIQGQNLRHLYQESGYFGNLAFMHVWISWGILGLELAVAVYELVAGMVRKRRYI